MQKQRHSSNAWQNAVYSSLATKGRAKQQHELICGSAPMRFRQTYSHICDRRRVPNGLHNQMWSIIVSCFGSLIVCHATDPTTPPSSWPAQVNEFKAFAWRVQRHKTLSPMLATSLCNSRKCIDLRQQKFHLRRRKNSLINKLCFAKAPLRRVALCNLLHINYHN